MTEKSSADAPLRAATNAGAVVPESTDAAAATKPESTPDKPRRPLAKWVIWPTAIIVIGLSLFAILLPSVAEAFFQTLQTSIVNGFSWWYVLLAVVFVAFSLFVGFSRFGDIKLGKDDDEPEFRLLPWFSLLFAAGMGIGLVFYGVSEPLSHFVTPKPGVEGTPEQLAQSALTQTYLHWGISAWAIYVVVGLALAYAIHRRGRPISIRWALEPLLGRKVWGAWGNVIDVIALVGTIFGVATSLGLGVLQIGSGLEAAGFGAPDQTTQVIIIAVITVFVLFSVLSGVTKGMKWLSTFNLLLAAALLLFVLLAGPTQFLLREWVQSIGGYIQNFIGLSFSVSAFQGTAGEEWQAGWTSFYWGWWMSWAPFVGIFIARVSRGRTVRQFVAGVLLVPTLIGILWFAVLGGTALQQELTEPGSMLTDDGTVNLQGALFQLFEHLPATGVLTIGAIILIAIFFITSADSGALVMGMIATGGDVEPSRAVRTFFTLMTSVLAIALLIAGGLNALQAAAIAIALPFSIVMLLICWATIVAFQRERRLYDRTQRHAFVDQIGEHYGLEVEGPNEEGVRMPVRRRVPRLRRSVPQASPPASPEAP